MATTNTPKIIATRFAEALIDKLSLTTAQVGVWAAADGSAQGLPPFSIQVVPGGLSPAGGDQDGDRGLYVRQTFDLVMFFTLNVDLPDRSEQLLTKDAEGTLDMAERIREVFAFTYLGNASLEKIRFEGETPTAWIDSERGIVMRTISFSAVWMMRWSGNQQSVDLPSWNV